MKMKSEREVAQSCLTLSDPMHYSLPGSSVHGIFQARILEWGAIAFSESSLPPPKHTPLPTLVFPNLLMVQPHSKSLRTENLGLALFLHIQSDEFTKSDELHLEKPF